MIVLILRQFVYQPLYTIDSSSYLCCFPFYSKRQQNEKKMKNSSKKKSELNLHVAIIYFNIFHQFTCKF